MQVKDVNFAQQQIIVCDGKGRESRVTMLPVNIAEELKMHLQSVKLLHQQDLQKGYGSVFLPFALKKKYPQAKYEWIWQFVFLLEIFHSYPRSGKVRRYHIHKSGLQKAVKKVVQDTKISKKVGFHTFRLSSNY